MLSIDLITHPPLTLSWGLCSSSSPAADIGAGTGIGSRQLAERSCPSIEPDPAMRQAAPSTCGVSGGTAEATNLPDASVDLVTCFSVTWFQAEPPSVPPDSETIWTIGVGVEPPGSDEFTASCTA